MAKIKLMLVYRPFFSLKNDVKWEIFCNFFNFSLYWWLFGSTKSGHFGTFFNFFALIRHITFCQIYTSIPAFFPSKMTKNWKLWTFFPFYSILMAFLCPPNLAILALFSIFWPDSLLKIRLYFFQLLGKIWGWGIKTGGMQIILKYKKLTQTKPSV